MPFIVPIWAVGNFRWSLSYFCKYPLLCTWKGQNKIPPIFMFYIFIAFTVPNVFVFYWPVSFTNLLHYVILKPEVSHVLLLQMFAQWPLANWHEIEKRLKNTHIHASADTHTHTHILSLSLTHTHTYTHTHTNLSLSIKHSLSLT